MAAADYLDGVRNYLDVTWEDTGTDEKLTGFISRGMAYLDDVAGTAQDYGAEGLPRALLLDYCRYAWNNALELFAVNFQGELISLRMGVQAYDYADEQGYI